MIKTWLGSGEVLDLLGQVNFGGTSSWNKSPISGKSLDAVDTVINSSLEIVEHGGGGTSENDGGHFVFILVSSDDGAFLRGDFLEVNFVSVTKLIWGWSLQLNNWSCTNSSSNSLQFPFGHDFHGQYLVFLEEVDSSLRH